MLICNKQMHWNMWCASIVVPCILGVPVCDCFSCLNQGCHFGEQLSLVDPRSQSSMAFGEKCVKWICFSTNTRLQSVIYFLFLKKASRGTWDSEAFLEIKIIWGRGLVISNMVILVDTKGFSVAQFHQHALYVWHIKALQCSSLSHSVRKYYPSDMRFSVYAWRQHDIVPYCC